MPESSKKNKSLTTPVITSPDGVKIKITEGRKLQLIREYARDPLVTDAQFRALAVMTDRTNEGYGSDETKWGYSYANYETLAEDTAKTPSAVKRIVQELESGEREVGTGKKKEIKPCRVALSVERDSRPGRSKVNRYWQRGWNEIAAVEDAEKGPAARPFQDRKGPVSDDKGSGLSDERVRFSDQKGPAARPDSSFTDSPQRPTSQDSKNAFGIDPAVEDVSERPQPRLVVDNDELDRYRLGALKVWDVLQKRPPKEKDEFISIFVEQAKAGEIQSSEEVINGLKGYFDCVDLKFQMNPVRLLKTGKWKEYRTPKKSRWKRGMAI